MESQENTHFIDKVVENLRKAATELEELQLKVALGKAEASDKYEEVKKKLSLFIHDSKSKINTGKEKVEEIQAKLEELRVQLALGKAETLEKFIEQKKKILQIIHDIKVKIKTNKTLNQAYAFLSLELEKFVTQLELLEKKFEDGKADAKNAFEKGKKEFNGFIDGVKEKFGSQKETQEKQWEHFQDEISEAFTHFKQAFSKV
jgi:ribosomal protein L29